MKEENKKIIEETIDEINSALQDSKGIQSHQRRVSFLLSLGSVALIEIYLEKQKVFKSGGKINHLWLKKSKENAKKLISNQIICPIENLEKLDKILDSAYEIEKERNELAYGKQVSEEKLNKKINLFIELKRGVEND